MAFTRLSFIFFFEERTITSGVQCRGQMQPSSRELHNFEREKYLYLTTRGRKSGLSREIEIWFTYLRGRFYVIAEYPTSNWVQNLGKDSDVKVRVSEREFAGRARVLSEETDGELVGEVQSLSRQKYGWGDGLVVEIVPSA
jgi:deazaflavin-dependent oxidoreductase (nitroreductase family)